VNQTESMQKNSHIFISIEIFLYFYKIYRDEVEY